MASTEGFRRVYRGIWFVAALFLGWSVFSSVCSFLGYLAWGAHRDVIEESRGLVFLVAPLEAAFFGSLYGLVWLIERFCLVFAGGGK